MTVTKTTLRRISRKKAYSAAALTFLAAGGAEAQVVLTDIDPDVTYSAPDGVFYLDLDNDGTEDFLFSATSAAAFVIGSGGTNQYAINGVFASPYGSNEILVNSVFSGFAYPAVLNSMDMIGSSDLFAAVSFQSLAYSFQYSSGGGLSPVEQNGNWLGGTDGKFIGLKLHKDGADHYGWLRLDVGSDNKSFTVSMYAYEATPGQGITVISTGIQDAVLTNWTVYSYGSMIHLIQNSTAETGTYQVLDLSGRTLLSGNMYGTHTTVMANQLPAGIYVVRLETASGTLSRKVYVNQ